MQPTDAQLPNNGVRVPSPTHSDARYRSYEVYQRERLGESTELLGPGQLTAARQLTDPYPLLALLRENYPCYRDWSGNAYWLTRYDQVTSIFSDRANFHLPNRAQSCSLKDAEDLSASVAAHKLWAELIDEQLPNICDTLLSGLGKERPIDLTIDYALALSNELQRRALGIQAQHTDELAQLLWHIQRADSWQPEVALGAQIACSKLLDLLANSPADKTSPGLREAIPGLGPQSLLATVLGFETRTLHGWVCNLAHAWLTNTDIQTEIRKGQTNIKIAALEAMRYTPPVPYAHAYAKHEVERFGRLLPEGALMRLSAEAANRDPRVFDDPDTFYAVRADLCHREARGQFRADGLATGIAFGLGLPSKHPAVPEDRPRSLFALTRDATVTATHQLLQHFPVIQPCGELKGPSALAIYEPMVAWSLPVTLT